MAAIVVAGVGVAPAGASPQDELEKKRAQAEALQAEIDANGTRISILDEQYNQTVMAIETANAGLAENQAKFDEATARSEELRSKVASRAAVLYVGAAGGSPLGMLDAPTLQEVGTRSKYGAAAAEEDENLINELTLAKEELADARAALEASLAAAKTKQQELEATRQEIERASQRQEALLKQVQGEIGDLVAQIEAQRRAEEEARARAEFERKRAEEAAKAEAARREAEARRQAEASRPRSAPSAQPARGGSDVERPNVPAPSSRAQIAIDTALAQLGKPYRYAGKGPDVFDCSGLTQFAWAAAGVSIPGSSQAQYAALPHVSRDQLAPGDLVFYGSPIHHVGIYLGNGQYVHAPQTGDVVKISSIHRSDYAGAARPG